jgi:phage protein D
MKTPVAEIAVNGRPVASIFNERLISVTIVDKEGVSSDTISCELNDGNPFAAIPRKGDIITARLGYRETGLLDFGAYTADDPEVHCLPYKMVVAGKGTDMRKTPKQHGARHWDGKTVKDILTDIAADNGWTPKIDAKVAGYKYAWFGQEDESDIHVAERLARRHGALFTVKNGTMIFAAKGTGQSASGAALTAVTASPDNIVENTCRTTFAHRNSFAKVKAHAQDRKTATRIDVEADSDADGATDYTLPEAFVDKDEAQKGADAKAKDLKSETIRTSVTVFGDPSIRAGAPFRYAGVRPELDGIEFIIETATHTISKSGYTTEIEAKLGDAESGSGATGGKSASSSSTLPSNADFENSVNAQ